MTVAELRQLRDEIQTALSGKIEMEREELQQKVDQLSELENSVAGDGGKGLQSSQRKAGLRSRRVAAAKLMANPIP